MTMFNITDGNNNVSRDKPVEHIDLVIGLHVSACAVRTAPCCVGMEFGSLFG